MNALDKAIYEALKGASSVTKLLPNGAEDIHADQAPESATFPHIVFGELTGTPAYTFTERVWEQFLYRVKAVTQDASAKLAKEIAEAVDAVLSDGEFSITGQSLMYSRKLNDMPPLTETVETRRYNHRGGHFEIWVQPA